MCSDDDNTNSKNDNGFCFLFVFPKVIEASFAHPCRPFPGEASWLRPPFHAASPQHALESSGGASMGERRYCTLVFVMAPCFCRRCRRSWLLCRKCKLHFSHWRGGKKEAVEVDCNTNCVIRRDQRIPGKERRTLGTHFVLKIRFLPRETTASLWPMSITSLDLYCARNYRSVGLDVRVFI